MRAREERPQAFSWVSVEEESREIRAALGYLSVPADAVIGESVLLDQAAAIEGASLARGLRVRQLVSDVSPADGGETARPALRTALDRIAGGEACALVVAKLDQLGASAASLGSVLDWFGRRNARLIAADLDLDTGTPAGRVAVRALVAAGELERQKLGDGTRRGLAAARARGARAGRPAVADRPALRQNIERWRKSGMTLQAIADRLNEEGVPTLRGGAEWRPSSVQATAGYKRPDRARGLAHLPRSSLSHPGRP